MEGLGRTCFASTLEPIVGDTPTVAWQVFERIQSVKAIDWYFCDGLWFSQAQIDRNTTATVFIDAFASPKHHTATRWTKVELKCFASGKWLSLAGDVNALVLIVVCPK